jgi:hypothetical protein
MIRLLRAMIWLRWRLLLGAIRGGRRRDTLEQISRALALVIPLAFGALSLGTLVAVAICGFLGGRAAASGLVEPALIVLIVRIAMAVMVGLTIIITISSPVQATLTRYNRLLLLPIATRLLHGIEVAANVADPLLAMMMPGMLAFAVGLVAGGHRVSPLFAALAAVVMIGVLASLGAALGFLIAWLFRSRRRGEVFTLVLVIGLSMLSFIPAALSRGLDGDRRAQRRRAPAETVQQFDASLPRWSIAVPSELYGRSILAAIEGRRGDAFMAIAVLAGEGALLYIASAAVHRRLILSLEGDARRRKSASARRTIRSLPFVSGTVSAVAIAQFRTAMRSVRGRLAVLMPGPLIAMLTLIFRGMPDEAAWSTVMSSQGHLIFAVGIVFSMYALQAFTMNAFGADRRGLALQFVSPIDDGDLALGKVLGCGMILSIAVALSAGAALIVAPNGSPYYWIATLAGGVATFMLLSPITIAFSAMFPIASDLSKTGAGGNPHPLPMFGGTIITLVAAIPAALIVAADVMWIQRPAVALMWMVVWMLMATAVAIPLVGLASRSIGLRRENLALVAHGR